MSLGNYLLLECLGLLLALLENSSALSIKIRDVGFDLGQVGFCSLAPVGQVVDPFLNLLLASAEEVDAKLACEVPQEPDEDNQVDNTPSEVTPSRSFIAAFLSQGRRGAYDRDQQSRHHQSRYGFIHGSFPQCLPPPVMWLTPHCNTPIR